MNEIRGLFYAGDRPRRAHHPAIVEPLEPRVLLATVTVDVVNFAFNPDPVTFHVGDTVHWVWDSDNHSTTSVAGSAESWDSGVHGTGFTFDHTFSQAGSYVYYCVVHGSDNGNGTASGMAGRINVQSTGGTVSSISVMPGSASVPAGTIQQFMAMGTLSDGSTQDLTGRVAWASANPAVATVSNAAGSQGLATAVAAGNSTITASLGGVTGSAVLTVTGPPPPVPSAIGRFRSSGLKIQAKVDKTFHGYVAYFSEPNTSPKDFHVAIDWGDHSKRDPGHVHGRSNGHLAVIGQHRYIHRGVFHVTITIRDHAGRKIATESLVQVVG